MFKKKSYKVNATSSELIFIDLLTHSMILFLLIYVDCINDYMMIIYIILSNESSIKFIVFKLDYCFIDLILKGVTL